MQFRPIIRCFIVQLASWMIAWGPSFILQADDGEEKFWSFQPVGAVAPAVVRSQDWLRSAVDAFVLAKLEERGLSPSPAADRQALIRRATFDLTGLPPTLDEI